MLAQIMPRLLLLWFCLVKVSTEDQNSGRTTRTDSWLMTLWGGVSYSDTCEKKIDKEKSEESALLSNEEDEVIQDQLNISLNSLEEAADNVNQSRVKHVCVPYEGCTPEIKCANFSELNDTNLHGIINQGKVVGVNFTQLQYLLDNVTASNVNACVIVMFYTRWCQYSIDFAPVYNQLGVVFPQMPVTALDFGVHSSDRYLLAYVPRVILYYAGRVVHDIDTTMAIENLTDIISNMTGLAPMPIPSDEEMAGFDSPLPKEVEEDETVLMLAVTAVAIIIFGSCIQKSELFVKCTERIFHD